MCQGHCLTLNKLRRLWMRPTFEKQREVRLGQFGVARTLDGVPATLGPSSTIPRQTNPNALNSCFHWTRSKGKSQPISTRSGPSKACDHSTSRVDRVPTTPTPRGQNSRADDGISMAWLLAHMGFQTFMRVWRPSTPRRSFLNASKRRKCLRLLLGQPLNDNFLVTKREHFEGPARQTRRSFLDESFQHINQC